MAGDEPVRGVAVAVLTPALGEHEFLLRLQHGETPDFLQVAGKPALGGKGREGRGTGHSRDSPGTAARATALQ